MTSSCLIVCNDRGQIESVKSAFELNADYRVYGDALVGARYAKIICMRPTGIGLELEMQRKELHEHILTRVACDGVLIIV